MPQGFAEVPASTATATFGLNDSAGRAGGAGLLDVAGARASNRPTQQDEESSNTLAELVLGTSIVFSKHKGNNSGNRLDMLDQTVAEENGNESIDFHSQPQMFRVKGLLCLPPLKMLQGQQLPALHFTPNYMRPTSASTTSSRV